MTHIYKTSGFEVRNELTQKRLCMDVAYFRNILPKNVIAQKQFNL
jgi:hypothetical protein